MNAVRVSTITLAISEVYFSFFVTMTLLKNNHKNIYFTFINALSFNGYADVIFSTLKRLNIVKYFNLIKRRFIHFI